MKNIKYSVKAYSSVYFNEWNKFIVSSKNGTFLFHRNFMEYHNDRFKDFSLMVFDRNKLVAVLPANILGNEMYSHQGLTYGGLVYSEKIKLSTVLEIIKTILLFLKDIGIVKIHYKQLPYIYHKIPSQETEYILFLLNSTLVRRDSLSVIENASKIKIGANRMEGVKKGIANNFIVKKSDNFKGFWSELLIPTLKVRHNTRPVHNVEEMIKLESFFPNSIKLYIIEHNGRILAGTVLFETDTVVHVQYIASGEDKNELGSLDYLFYYLITVEFAHKKYFDFGISNEQGGRKINNGLSFWKESYGARTVIQDFYEIDTANHYLLDNVII
ncbi:GNAT family N-acetyltransferase [Flavobacterium sp. NRK1]|uniref:GNAT family N-acetyltransferase n=1 Tax=Flavobacterium sp. NRK1 TaxID=2954929 RepID=UPI002093530A|nr:GNAT family N-acetyltransferase [Flavobacterium sp. NRK1]MCO6148637.1 GNAT family N-acetyltransferase [Flavobacterium sp. NRK1]